MNEEMHIAFDKQDKSMKLILCDAAIILGKWLRSVDHGVTAKELLDTIIAKFPPLKKELLQEDGRLYGHVHLSINGRDVQFLADNLDTKIMPEDEISLFPAVGGG
jgi:molybdopterin synthase sulfur carrier subunit